MKTIGLLGGFTWHSTQRYYRIINETVAESLEGLHSAKCIIYSLDFAEIVHLQNHGDWINITSKLLDAADILQQAQIDFLVLCSNTLHKVADEIQKSIKIPLLDIVDITGKELKKTGLKKVGLLGTKITMEHGFYQKKLKDHYGIIVETPKIDEREYLDTVIFTELCQGQFRGSSKRKVLEIIQDMENQDLEGIIMGCTEIPFLLSHTPIILPLFDSLSLHAKAAATEALRENSYVIHEHLAK